MKEAPLYARVSTTKGAQSLEMQLDDLRGYCGRRSWVVLTPPDQLRIAVAEPKRRVGWTVDQLIARLHIVGVTVAVGFPNTSENGNSHIKVLECRI
jgi:hypothetical protein